MNNGSFPFQKIDIGCRNSILVCSSPIWRVGGRLNIWNPNSNNFTKIIAENRAEETIVWTVVCAQVFSGISIFHLQWRNNDHSTVSLLKLLQTLIGTRLIIVIMVHCEQSRYQPCEQLSFLNVGTDYYLHIGQNGASRTFSVTRSHMANPKTLKLHNKFIKLFLSLVKLSSILWKSLDMHDSNEIWSHSYFQILLKVGVSSYDRCY